MNGQTPGRVAFLVVGSPRSGTTLVQRLASELPGVTVPYETHFFTKGYECFERHGGFPIHGSDLVAALREYTALPALDGAGLDPDALAAGLRDRANDALTVFDAVVTAAARNPPVLGEKTPGHVHWAARLATIRPDLVIVGVVRDPRAVIASSREVPWGRAAVDVLADRWRDTQEELTRIAAAAPGRTLVLRYEDVVRDPAAARIAIAARIGVPGTTTGTAVEGTHVGGGEAAALPWEHWKALAAEPVTETRVDRWQSELDGLDIARVRRACGALAAEFGYDISTPRADRFRAAVPDRGARRRRKLDRARIARIRRVVAGANLGQADDSGWSRNSR